MPNNSDSIFTQGKNSKISSMISAMRGWETSLASSASKPDGTFGRTVKIQVAGLTITNDLDVEFTVPFDDDTEPNEAEIVVYNLSKKTVGLLKPDTELTITAGYGSDTGIIFSGVITFAKTKWNDLDKITTIHVIDDIKVNDRDIDAISFKAGVKASYVLKTLVGKLKLPIAVFQVRYDHTYSEALTVSGNLMDNINKYAEVCGVSAYINKRKVYVRHLSDGDDLGFSVNSDNGLIGSPEEFTEEVDNEDYKETVSGVKFKMLLEHRITTASIVKLQSRDISGTYRVREGQHVCNETDFYTEITAVEPASANSSSQGSGTKNIVPASSNANKVAGGGTKRVMLTK